MSRTPEVSWMSGQKLPRDRHPFGSMTSRVDDKNLIDAMRALQDSIAVSPETRIPAEEESPSKEAPASPDQT